MNLKKKIALSSIILNPKNPRIIKDGKYEKLKKSIADFPKMMELRGIIVDGADMILGGNMRYQALVDLGFTEIPRSWVKRATDLTEKEKRQFIIKDNIPYGDWEIDILRDEFDVEDLEEWALDDLDFEVGGSGGSTDEDSVPEIPREAVTKLGDLYQLGEHRLLCGDATNRQEIECLMQREQVDMVFADPPYGVDYSGKNEMLNKFDKGNRIQKPIENDSISDYRKFFADFLTVIPMADYNICYISMSGQELHSLRLAFQDAGFYWSDYLIWVKNNHVLGRKDYNAKHEFIMYGWKNHHKFYGKSATTLLEYDRPTKSDLHPTMKPVELIERLIQDGSKENFIVYDCFGGSGSTLIACEKTGRKCRMIEIDPIYCDVIVKRYEDYSGKKAQLIKG